MEKMLKDLTLEEANAICNGLILDYPDDACSIRKLPSSVIDEYKNK